MVENLVLTELCKCTHPLLDSILYWRSTSGAEVDFIIRKSDGMPTYHLACVVDDELMGVTHIIRGQEHLMNTPGHQALQDALGFRRPAYVHMSVTVSPDGGKLSKRKGAASVMDYKKNGYLPEALCNFLALLGWAPGDDREKMTKDEILKKLNIKNYICKDKVRYDVVIRNKKSQKIFFKEISPNNQRKVKKYHEALGCYSAFTARK